MNHYYEIAALYFKRFEGAQFFPKRYDSRNIYLFISLAIFCFYFYWFFIAHPIQGIFEMWPFYASELLLLVCAFRIVSYKDQALLASLPVDDEIPRDQIVHHAKRSSLIELAGRPEFEFLQLLDEIKKLQALEQEHRSRLDPDVLKSFLHFLNLPVWTRIVAVLLALAGVFFGKPEKLTEISFSELFAHPQMPSVAWALGLLVIGLFVVGFAVYIVTQQLLEVGALLISARWPAKRGNTTMLSYMMRDLIKYYAPEPKSKPAAEVETEAAQEAESSLNDKPASIGIALAALVVQALHKAWLNSNPQLKK